MSIYDELGLNLTPRHKRFAEEYVKDYSRRRAYKAVFKNCKKDSTAYSNGYKLLQKAQIRRYIDVLIQERAKLSLEQAGVTQEKITKELAAIGFTNINDVSSDWGENKPFDEVSEVAKKAISETKIYKNERVDKEGNVSSVKTTVITKFHDKISALTKLQEMLDNTKVKQSEEESESKGQKTEIHVTFPDFSKPRPNKDQES